MRGKGEEREWGSEKKKKKSKQQFLLCFLKNVILGSTFFSHSVYTVYSGYINLCQPGEFKTPPFSKSTLRFAYILSVTKCYIFHDF